VCTQPADPEAQYRLDYTNCHVDTDADTSSIDSPSSANDDIHHDLDRGQRALESRLKVAGWKQESVESEEGGDDRLRMLDCDPSSFIFPQVE
jgi:hypothetical protein